VFGSTARGGAGSDSDVDFLVEIEGPTSPWFLGGLVAVLEDLLGRRVGVVEANALWEPLRQRILQEALPPSRATEHILLCLENIEWDHPVLHAYIEDMRKVSREE
jgi:hypothetical protein